MAKGKGVVAAGHELTAAAAAEILQDGGNAFDAALAGIFMTFVAEAVFASPGGGGFLMARRAQKDSATLFDFFAETPRKRRPESEIAFFPIFADFGPAKQEFHIGAGSSATPGVVPGLFALHEALCRLPMKRLVEPAVRAARQGFPLSEFQAYLFTVIAPILTASESVARIFAPDGKPMTRRRHLPQRGARRDACMARRGRGKALHRRRCRPGDRGAVARAWRLSHP